MLARKTPGDHTHLAEGSINAPQEQGTRCPSKNPWPFECPCEDASAAAAWMNTLERGPLLWPTKKPTFLRASSIPG